jgi:hypothetical protein
MQLPKIKISKKQLKIFAWVLGSALIIMLALGAVAYSKREALLHSLMEKALRKAKDDYGLSVTIGKYEFSGLSKVSLHHIDVVPADRDTLSQIKHLEVGVRLMPLLFGHIKLADLSLSDGKLSVVMRDSLSNIDFILKRKKKDTQTSDDKLNLAKVAENLLSEVLYKIPENMEVSNFMLSLNDNDTAGVRLQTTKATIASGDLKSEILVNDTLAKWHVNGQLDPDNKQLSVSLFADGKKVELPYLQQKLHLKLSFDTVKTEMKEAGYSSGDYRISGSWSVRNLTLNHARIAATDIVVPSATVDADMLIGKNYLALDSTSTVKIKEAFIYPFVKYTLSPNKIYELKVDAPQQNAQAIFDSFPLGLFDSLDGIKVQGKLSYHLNFYLDSSVPDSVKFSSSLRPSNFKILQFGATNLQKINSSFVYTPYEYGKPMRNIVIGPENNNFTRLEEISPNFKNALLTAEDPSFFHHKGFVEESFRKSIAVNFKEKKFKRGGSTISMQLVKNIFLNRKKTVSRKVEEALIVWLIENNRLVSKSRMLEVYFNIIELGNNVYGIGEASRYYFDKRPADLSLGEGIFLANLVPKPKIAIFKFASNGGLKSYLMPYFKFIGGIMARRGLAPADSTGYGFYDVHLREGLRHLLPPDTLAIDTNAIEVGEDDMMTPEGMEDKSKKLFDRLYGDSTKVKKHTDTLRNNKAVRKEN